MKSLFAIFIPAAISLFIVKMQLDGELRLELSLLAGLSVLFGAWLHLRRRPLDSGGTENEFLPGIKRIETDAEGIRKA